MSLEQHSKPEYKEIVEEEKSTVIFTFLLVVQQNALKQERKEACIIGTRSESERRVSVMSVTQLL